MPQMTNRKLVGEMSATPIGRGTIYSSMLKVCATNRERAARVNNGERQRLQKATKVIDKDNRHNQWKLDQDMERVRRSLMKLDAFQRVLHENYSVEKLLGKMPTPVKNKDMEAHHSRKEHTESTRETEEKRAEFQTPKFSTHLPKHSGKETETRKKTKTNQSSAEFGCQRQLKVHFSSDLHLSDKTGMSDTKTELHHRKHPDVIETVKLANDTKQELSLECTAPPQTKLKDENESKQSLLHEILKSDKTSPLCLNAKGSLSTTNQKKLSKQINHQNRVERVNGSSKIIGSKSSESTPSRPAVKGSHGVKTSSKFSSDQRTMRPVSLNFHEPSSELSPEQQRRRDLIEKRRSERQMVMESKVCNRGFDMITLRVDIERKLRKMDAGRQNRRLKRYLLAESMSNSERVLQTNKAKFDTEIMDPHKKVSLSRADMEEDRQESILENHNTAKLVPCDPETEKQDEYEGKVVDSVEENYIDTNVHHIPFNPLLHKVPLY